MLDAFTFLGLGLDKQTEILESTPYLVYVFDGIHSINNEPMLFTGMAKVKHNTFPFYNEQFTCHFYCFTIGDHATINHFNSYPLNVLLDDIKKSKEDGDDTKMCKCYFCTYEQMVDFATEYNLLPHLL